MNRRRTQRSGTARCACWLAAAGRRPVGPGRARAPLRPSQALRHALVSHQRQARIIGFRPSLLPRRPGPAGDPGRRDLATSPSPSTPNPRSSMQPLSGWARAQAGLSRCPTRRPLPPRVPRAQGVGGNRVWGGCQRQLCCPGRAGTEQAGVLKMGRVSGG